MVFVSLGGREVVRVDAFGGVTEWWEHVTVADLDAGDVTPLGRVKRTVRLGEEVLLTLEDGRTRRCRHSDAVSRRTDLPGSAADRG